MQVGDPKKAGGLILIAVLAIGFAIYRSIPKAEPRVASTAPAADAPADAVKAETLDFSLPIALVTDPFSHPKLASGVSEQPGNSDRVDIPDPRLEGGLDRNPEARRLFGGGNRPWVPDGLPGITLSPTGGTGGKPTGKPVENTGGNRELQREPISIKLSAILRVEKTVALVQVGSDSIQVAVGDLIAGKFKVVAITETEMVLRSKAGSRRVGLGKEVQL